MICNDEDTDGRARVTTDEERFYLKTEQRYRYIAHCCEKTCNALKNGREVRELVRLGKKRRRNLCFVHHLVV